MKNLSVLVSTVHSIRCLVFNPHLTLDSHLEQLMPAVLTTILGPKLSNSHKEDHWALCSPAAELVAHMCSKYRDPFPDLQAQVCQTYLNELRAPAHSNPVCFASLYGSVIGLSSLGHQVVRSLILPELETLELKLVPNGVTVPSEEGVVARTVVTEYERAWCLHGVATALGKHVIASLRMNALLPGFHPSRSRTFLIWLKVTSHRREERNSNGSKRRWGSHFPFLRNFFTCIGALVAPIRR